MDVSATPSSWYCIANAGEIPSPALVFYPERIEENIRRMMHIAGSASRLRPHVKTHKTPEVVALQVRHGIRAFKCATMAEAEMTASAGGTDVLLALQPVGPALERFLRLQQAWPGCSFSAVVDCDAVIGAFAGLAAAAGVTARLWLDVNCGMNRTGVSPGPDAVRLYRRVCGTPGLEPGGLHVYDGHIHDHDPDDRARTCETHYAPVQRLIDDLRGLGLPVPEIVTGGTPTFPLHARRPGVTLSPGTPLLWDAGYSSSYLDLDFLHAAVLLTRVVSKPAPGLVCFDLGTKALASEMPQPRVVLLGMDGYRIVAHNEEHLVIETAAAARFTPGDAVYGIPIHICPTVARYESASIVQDGRCTGEWRITARDRRITV